MEKSQKNLETALMAVAILWVVYFLNMALPFDLRSFGIRPRNLQGLWGIGVAPLLHGNLDHLIANSGALFVLLIVALSFSRKLTFSAIAIIILIGGSLVWLLGLGNTIHIGASGIIFGLIGFLMFIGVFRREWVALIVSIAVCLLYGGALLSLLQVRPGISWSSHCFGFLSGVMAAWWTKAKSGK